MNRLLKATSAFSSVAGHVINTRRTKMLKKHPLALYITWIVALAVIPLPLIILTNSQLTADYEDLFAYDVGILAYVWWLVIIFLSTRPRWLEKYIGNPLQCIFCMLR